MTKEHSLSTPENPYQKFGFTESAGCAFELITPEGGFARSKRAAHGDFFIVIASGAKRSHFLDRRPSTLCFTLGVPLYSRTL